MLMGEFHHNIDEKNRLVIPSKFRTELGEKFVITRGLDKCLFVYSIEEWNKFADKLKMLPFTHRDARNFTRFLLSLASYIVKLEEKPITSCSMRKIRKNTEWNVPIHK